MSLGRFQNCNLLEMDHFRRHGVQDESNVKTAWGGGPVIHCDRLPVSLSCNSLRKLHYLQVLNPVKSLNPVWGYPNPRNATPKIFQIISFNLIHVCSNIIIVSLSTKANSWTLEWPIVHAGERRGPSIVDRPLVKRHSPSRT
jgi:hypothetical protein